MMEYYKQLFGIEFSHGFYIQAICHDLLLEPTDECMQVLRRHGLLFKQQATGGVVVCKQYNIGTTASPILKPKVAIAPDTLFTFQLRLKHPDFLTITSVDQRQIKPFSGFIFVNTLGTSSSTDGMTRTVQIHNGALGNPLACVGKLFRYAIAADLDTTLVAVHKADGQGLLQIHVPPNLSEIRVDLSGFPEGIYHLHSFNAAGTKVLEDAVFVSDAYLVARLFGFLQVRYRDDLLQGTEEQLMFSLRFENRQIRWVYIIDVKDGEPGHPDTLNPNTIQLQAGTVAFTRSQTAQRVTFTSTQPIPLKQQAHQGIQLIRDATPPGILIPHMPNPEPSHLVKDGDSGFRAEMHLTIR